MVEQKIENEWLLEFESVQKWFESLIRKRKGKDISIGMRTNYNSRIRQLVIFMRVGGDESANPDSILEWARGNDPIKVVDMLNDHSRWLQGEKIKGYKIRSKIDRKGELKYPKMSQSSADQVTHGALRGFFTHNGLLLPGSGRIKNGRSVTKKNDANFAIFRIDPETNMVVSDYSQLRYFLGFLKNRDKIIALSMLNTSQDPVDILGLNIGFVKNQKDKPRLLWEGERTKTGEEFRVFFSESVTKDLKRYVENERGGAENDEPLFVRKQRDGKSIRLKPVNLSENFKSASHKSGFTKGSGQNPFRPKRMRSIFSSACYQAKIDDGARHIFMGHSGSISENYREMPVANLEQIYIKIEPFLAVYSEDMSGKLGEADKKSQQALDLALDLREENKKLNLELDGMRSEMKTQENLLQMVIERIVWLEGETSEGGKIPNDAKPITAEEKEAFRKGAKGTKV